MVAAWRGAEGRRTWRTWWQRRESEGKTRSLADAGRAAATAERSGEVGGGDGGGNRRPEQSTRLRLECLMCSEGEVKCSGYDNQVAREGRGM